MPSIEELQRFQFEDFSLERSRRTPLTVLGEHAFGMEQGRIVTGVVASESEEGGGGGDAKGNEEPTGACCIGDGICSIKTQAACLASGGMYQGDGTACDPNPCPACPFVLEIIDAAISGHSSSAEECGEVDIPLSGGSTSGLPGDECTATATFDLVYECPEDCYPETEHIIRLNASMAYIAPNWFLALSSELDMGDGDICGNFVPFGSSPMVAEENLGADPTGDHVFSFDDGDEPTIHWDITVRIT